MEPLIKASSAVTKKRKLKTKTKVSISEHKNVRVGAKDETHTTEVTPKVKKDLPKPIEKVDIDISLTEEMVEHYPILKNQELIDRFLKVPMTNNQKGRIRQTVKDSLQGTSNVLVPDIINNKIQAIIKATPELKDSDLRRIRILYNLLKTSLKTEQALEKKKGKIEKNKKKEKKANDGDATVKDGEKKDKEKDKQKVKGPKRYVVFVGNLPLTVDKEMIMNHFSEMNEHIKDIRIPKPADGKKSAIAYLELTNEPSYEFALSKHHSMMGTKRLNVLYTAQKNGKISKAEAKSKSAKLIALQKSGKLVGSISLSKKRSQRRLKMKKALSKLAETS